MFAPIILKKNTIKSIYKNSFNYQNTNTLPTKPNWLPIDNPAATIVFLKELRAKTSPPIPLMVRFERATRLPRNTSRTTLVRILSPLVNYFSFNSLYFFLTKLFWLIPVPKHKTIFYLIRAILKYVSNNMPNTIGLSVTFRGKLAVTGNKRKSSFTVLVGKGASSALNHLTESEFRLLQTPTGVIGVTSSLTYIH